MQKFFGMTAGLLWLMLGAGATAQAQTEAAPPVLAPVVAPVQPPSQTAERGARTAACSGWQPLALAVLAEKRAGSDTVSNNMDVAGSVSGNSAINVVTGANAISAASFANADGLPVAIQNSGANVLIQNATIINVQMR